MKRFALIAGLCLVALAALTAIFGWQHRQELLMHAQDWIEGRILKPEAPPKPDPGRYEVLSTELERWRLELAERYSKAENKEQRVAIEAEARLLLETVMPSMMRCWIGTRWDFNGTAAKPGAGKIACGYFVSTVLRDAGFRVNRYQLAQQASANIIHSFIAADSCTLSIGKSYDDFLRELKVCANGIYLVGLDTHVGFLVKNETDIHFIHSSGSKPWCVVDESRENASALEQSRWRMLGNLSANPQFIRSWLSGKDIHVVRN